MRSPLWEALHSHPPLRTGLHAGCVTSAHLPSPPPLPAPPKLLANGCARALNPEGLRGIVQHAACERPRPSVRLWVQEWHICLSRKQKRANVCAYAETRGNTAIFPPRPYASTHQWPNIPYKSEAKHHLLRAKEGERGDHAPSQNKM